MHTETVPDLESRSNLLHDIQKAYAFTLAFGRPGLDDRQAGMLESIWLRRIRAIGYGAPDLSEQFCLRGRMDDFHFDRDDIDEVHEEFARLYEQFEQDTLPPYGSLAELGTDAYATYIPIHQAFRGEKTLPGNLNWGIYVAEQGICRLAAMLQHHCQEEYGPPTEDLFLQASYQILLRSALAHFKLEAFALSAELVRREPLYLRYLAKVYLTQHRNSGCLEDALANATILSSQTVGKIFAKMYPAADGGSHSSCQWKPIVEKHFLACQPPGYRDYALNSIEHTAAGRGSSVRREAMNYLCNQLVTGELKPQQEVPYYAFPPDNYFLRGELLVPVHVLRAKSGVHAFSRRKGRR